MTTTTKTNRTNRYDAKCETCGRTVVAGTGVLKGRMVGGSRRWLVEHATCPIVATVALVDGHPCLVHSAADDECLGARCITGRSHDRAMATRYVGMTWAEVMEANEFFDGEPEITDAAHRRWVAENAAAELSGTVYARYLDTTTNWGDPSEAVMHAMEAWNDRQN